MKCERRRESDLISGDRMEYWAWVITGVALLGAEVLAPSGFVLMFFGAGAIAVGLVVASGVVSAVWMQWLLFSAISVTLVWTMRSRMLERVKAGPMDTDDVVGKVATTLGAIASGADGRVELRGATWEATNTGMSALADGERCSVVRKDGLRLFVSKDEPSFSKTGL